MKKVQEVDIQREHLAVIGLNNVSVIDTRVNKLNNNYHSYCSIIAHQDTNAPIFGSALQAKDATLANITALPATGLSVNDKLVIIAIPEGFSPFFTNPSIAGLFIAEKYMEFSQGGVHTVEIIPMKGALPDNVNKRTLTVEPTSGVNTVSEYVILPTIQPVTLGPSQDVAYGGGILSLPTSYSKSAGNYLTPWPLARPSNGSSSLPGYTAIAIIFKDLAGEGILSVSPIFGGIIASKMIADILNS